MARRRQRSWRLLESFEFVAGVLFAASTSYLPKVLEIIQEAAAAPFASRATCIVTSAVESVFNDNNLFSAIMANSTNDFLDALETLSAVELNALRTNYWPVYSSKIGLCYTPLILSLVMNNTEISRALIAAGADVNAGDFFKERPIIFASRFNQVSVVQDLIKNNAMPRTRDWHKKSPLQIAKENN